DERYRRPWREDSDLHFALLERDYRIVHAPRALVLHPVRPAPWGISARIQKNVFFDALLFKKHPRLYRTRIAAGPPLRYYFVVTALAVGLIGLITGHTATAYVGLGTWLVWT